MKTRCLVKVWMGLVCGVSFVACGGRSVLDDEWLYGDGNTAGIKGRIPALGTGLVDDTSNFPTGPATGVNPVGPTIPIGPTTTPATVAPATVAPTAVAPTAVAPTAVAPTAVSPATGVAPATSPTTTALPTTVPGTTTTVQPTTTSVPTSDSTSTTNPVVLIPFPADGSAPTLPEGFRDVEWNDPWSCSPETYEDGSYCSLSFHCTDTQFTSSSCTLVGDTWYCECSGNTAYASSQFATSSILPGQACRIAGSLCVSDVRAEESCSQLLDQGSDYCTFNSFCNRELRADRVVAKVATQTYSTCSYSKLNGEDYVSCSCSNTDFGELSVDWNPEESCVLVHDACIRGLDEGSLRDAECSWYASNSDRSYCMNTDRCIRPAMASGAPLGLVTNVQTNCYLDEGDAWQCGCDDNNGTIGRYFAESSRQACELARVDCVAELDQDQ